MNYVYVLVFLVSHHIHLYQILHLHAVLQFFQGGILSKKQQMFTFYRYKNHLLFKQIRFANLRHAKHFNLTLALDEVA